MPYIFIKVVYPTHKIDEVVKKNIEILSKYPPDPSLGETVVAATNATEQGIVSLTVYEVKEGKFIEAQSRWLKAVTEFRNIEGLEYSFETWATAFEAYEAIGKTPPG